MQTLHNAYRPARPSRLVAALASMVVSVSLLGAVLAGFGLHQADAATSVARVSSSRVG